MGGEEFVIYMPNTNPDNAFIFAERYREMIENLEIRIRLNLSGSPSVSGFVTLISH